MIIDYLKQNKPQVDSALQSLLVNAQCVTTIHASASSTLDRIARFSVNGKGIRGVLTLLGAQMYGKETDVALLQVAAAMELIHASLLMHDDIMDNDTLRIGQETIYYQYQKEGEGAKVNDPKHFGISMGICVGDIGLYLSLQTVAKLDIPAEIKVKLIDLLTSEITKTALAQMHDVSYGFGMSEPTVEDITFVNLYKTGRYTFSLPLMLGGLYAGKKLSEMTELEKIGESLGIVFQIVDDWLGLFAAEKDLGKPVGSDIRENKRTLIRHMLFAKADEESRNFLESVFGNHQIQMHDIQKVRELVINLKVKEEIDATVDSLSSEALGLIEKLQITDTHKELLKTLVQYNKTRFK